MATPTQANRIYQTHSGRAASACALALTLVAGACVAGDDTFETVHFDERVSQADERAPLEPPSSDTWPAYEDEAALMELAFGGDVWVQQMDEFVADTRAAAIGGENTVQNAAGKRLAAEKQQAQADVLEAQLTAAARSNPMQEGGCSPTAGDDFCQGDDQNDNFNGLDGDDTLLGGNGNDYITGGPGADTMDGEAGIDTVAYAQSQSGVTINLGSNAASGGDADGDDINGFEHVRGSPQNDSLTGDSGDNQLYGVDGVDVLTGGDGQDFLVGGAGGDMLDGGAGEADYAM